MAKKLTENNESDSVKKTPDAKLDTSEEVVAQVPAETHVAEDDNNPKRAFNFGQIAWGLVLIFFGILLLLDNLGAVSLQWSSIWKLWPLAIILAGVAALDIKGWLGVAVTTVVVIFSGGLILATLTDNIDKVTGVEEKSEKVTKFNIGRERDVERAEVSIDSGAGKVDITGHRGGDLVSGRLTSVITQLSQKSEVSNRVQKVELSLERGFQSWGVNPTNNVEVSLTRSVPIDLSVDTGAASIKADLEGVQVRSVEVDAGASSVWLKLGDKQREVKVDIDTGASSVDIHVPKNAGIKLNLDTGLSSKDLPSDLKKSGEDSYKSENYDDSEVRFNIDVDMGLSSFKIIRY